VVGRPTVVALNKIDRLSHLDIIDDWLAEFEHSVAISAAHGWHLDRLLAKVEEVLSEELVYIAVRVPYDRGDLAALFHEQGTVTETEHSAQGTSLKGFLSRRWLEQFREYLT
ncbi:MAG: GTPase HflX, partial [Anaerolineae bacterium]